MLEALESTWMLALVRAIHFASCLLAFGVVAFDRLIAAPALNGGQISTTSAWARAATRLLWISVVLALASGGVWLALAAVNMSGLPPREALNAVVLRTVLFETHFGRLWELRLFLWLATAGAIGLRSLRPDRGEITWAAIIFGGALAASLAWAGHGLDGRRYQWHILADALHILIGGIWPTGLLPFTMLFLELRRSGKAGKWIVIAHLTRRFSAASLISVAILAATGVVNSFYMLDRIADLVESDYGRMLLAKIVAFLLMVALGAMNLVRWKPRVCAEYNDQTPAAAARLQLNVAMEVTLSFAVLILVGFLGLMMPPMSGMEHMHHHHH